MDKYISLTHTSWCGRNCYTIKFLKFVKVTKNNIAILKHVQKGAEYFENEYITIHFNKLYTFNDVKLIASLPDIWDTMKLISVNDKLTLPQHLINFKKCDGGWINDLLHIWGDPEICRNVWN